MREQIVTGAARAFLSGSTRDTVEAFEELLFTPPGHTVILRLDRVDDLATATVKVYRRTGKESDYELISRFKASGRSMIDAVVDTVKSTVNLRRFQAHAQKEKGSG